MKSTTEQINKIVSREPKVQNGGMPSRNIETHSPTANCYATIPSGNNVKATVNKVLSKIK